MIWWPWAAVVVALLVNLGFFMGLKPKKKRCTCRYWVCEIHVPGDKI